MSFFDKILFWRKDDSEINKFARQDISETPDFLGESYQEKSAFPEPGTQEFQAPEPFQPKSQGMSNKELELISSKLDTVKAMLTSLDQRMSNIEKSAGIEKKQRLW